MSSISTLLLLESVHGAHIKGGLVQQNCVWDVVLQVGAVALTKDDGTTLAEGSLVSFRLLANLPNRQLAVARERGTALV